jgi:DUF917 family protein
MERILSNEELSAMLLGTGILGTGGGGSPDDEGKPIFEWDSRHGRKYKLVDPAQIGDTSLVVCVGYMGSVNPASFTPIRELLPKWEKRFELLEAVAVTEEILREKVNLVVPFEIGGGNTPIAMSLAARSGIGIVDGDGIGRAAPELQMSSFLGHGIQMTPAVIVDMDGNAVVLQRIVKPTHVDEIGRSIVTLNGGMAAFVGFPMRGSDLKRSIVPGTISKAIAVGNALKEARSSGRDVVKAVVNVTNGIELLKGVVKSHEGRDENGFYRARVTIEGKEEYSGKLMEIVFKNEAMAAFTDGKPVGIFPDLICLLDPPTGRGLMTVDLSKGTPVAVVGIPAHQRVREALQMQDCREAFAPARYGLPELSYVPMETLVGKI